MTCKLQAKEGKLSDAQVDSFRGRVNHWLSTFNEVYMKKHCTPYNHLFVCHVPYLLKHYGSVAQFTQQGLEKLKDLITIFFL